MKLTGFWLFSEEVVRSKVQEKGKRLPADKLRIISTEHWNQLTFEEKNAWRSKAKEYNKTEEGKYARQLKKQEARNRVLSSVLKSVYQPKVPSCNRRHIPSSRLYDQYDVHAKKYFGGVDDDFIAMREYHLNEFFDQFQWRLLNEDKEFRNLFFINKELILAAVNVYYEDDERMVPSELALLKFDISHGPIGQRSYLFRLDDLKVPNEQCAREAIENEQRTGLFPSAVNVDQFSYSDLSFVWEEVQDFTEINNMEKKILVAAKDWNVVVGTFDVLNSHAEKKAFSRVESHFATIEDYFLSMCCILRESRDADKYLEVDVNCEMRERWPAAICFDIVTCGFHEKLKNGKQRQARECALFKAHEILFNFYTLCKKYAFPRFPFCGDHMPDKNNKHLQASGLHKSGEIHRHRTTQCVDLQERAKSPLTKSEVVRSKTSECFREASQSSWDGNAASACNPDESPLSGAHQLRNEDKALSVLKMNESSFDVNKWLNESPIVGTYLPSKEDFDNYKPLEPSFYPNSIPRSVPKVSRDNVKLSCTKNSGRYSSKYTTDAVWEDADAMWDDNEKLQNFLQSTCFIPKAGLYKDASKIFGWKGEGQSGTPKNIFHDWISNYVVRSEKICRLSRDS